MGTTGSWDWASFEEALFGLLAEGLRGHVADVRRRFAGAGFCYRCR